MNTDHEEAWKILDKNKEQEMSTESVRKLNTERLDAINQIKKQYQEKMREEGEGVIKGMFREFFRMNPEIEAVQWTQYTPHFNDGDPCNFGVHEPTFKLKSDTPVEFLKENLDEYSLYERHYEDKTKEQCTPEELERYKWMFNSYRTTVRVETGKTMKSDEDILKLLGDGGDYENGFFYGFNKGEVADACNDLSYLIQSSDDIMEMIFGDHVQITVTRDGIDSEEYDHD